MRVQPRVLRCSRCKSTECERFNGNIYYGIRCKACGHELRLSFMRTKESNVHQVYTWSGPTSNYEEF